MGDKAGGALFLLWMSYWFGDLEWFEWHYCLNQRGWHDHYIGLYLDDNDGGIGGDQYYGITPYSVHFRSCIYVLWLVIEVFVFLFTQALDLTNSNVSQAHVRKAYGAPAPVICHSSISRMCSIIIQSL
jgi:hypothetical protein